MRLLTFMSIMSIGGNRYAHQFFSGIGWLTIFGLVILLMVLA